MWHISNSNSLNLFHSYMLFFFKILQIIIKDYNVMLCKNLLVMSHIAKFLGLFANNRLNWKYYVSEKCTK